MGEKSLKKKELILEKAREVFIQKGYKNVTMKDIVEACEISRGGLYLYFESTEQLFLEVLNMKEDEDEEDNVFVKAVKAHASSSDILALFLQEQKKELTHQSESLTMASYEFFFDHKLPKEENPLKQQFDAAVSIIDKLIRDGIATGEFVCKNPRATAANIMYALEGIRVMKLSVGISDKAINQEILYFMKNLLPQDELAESTSKKVE